MQITKGDTQSVGDEKRSTLLHKNKQDVAIPSRTKFERVYTGRNEKLPLQ